MSAVSIPKGIETKPQAAGNRIEEHRDLQDVVRDYLQRCFPVAQHFCHLDVHHAEAEQGSVSFG
jgi:hypothetical protein